MTQQRTIQTTRQWTTTSDQDAGGSGNRASLHLLHTILAEAGYRDPPGEGVAYKLNEQNYVGIILLMLMEYYSNSLMGNVDDW